MKSIKCDFCHKEIELKTNMPPTPSITVTGRITHFEYDCCVQCAVKILVNIGKGADAKHLLEVEK